MARIKVNRTVGGTTYYDAVMEFPPRYKPSEKAAKFSIGRDLNKTVRNKIKETLTQLEQHNAGLSEVMDRSLSRKIQGLPDRVIKSLETKGYLKKEFFGEAETSTFEQVGHEWLLDKQTSKARPPQPTTIRNYSNSLRRWKSLRHRE